MNGLMMEYPLTLPAILRRATTLYAEKAIVTRLADKRVHRPTYAAVCGVVTVVTTEADLRPARRTAHASVPSAASMAAKCIATRCSIERRVGVSITRPGGLNGGSSRPARHRPVTFGAYRVLDPAADETHLHAVLTEFVRFYNADRPHRSLDVTAPRPATYSPAAGGPTRARGPPPHVRTGRVSNDEVLTPDR